MILIISCCLPVNAYANGIDIINSILNRQQDSTNGMDLINAALTGKDHQDIKLISSKQEVAQEMEKSKNKATQGNNNSYILGVDISKWNGDVDWKALKKANIQFVIIRAGYSTYYVDPYFKSNIENAIKNNMTVGIYWFSYAHTYQGAKLEAEKCYKTIKPYKKHITLPVFWDFEYDSVNVAHRKGHSVSKKLVSGMADTFCTTIKNKGMQTGIYTNIDYTQRYFTKEVLAKYHTWIAQWTSTCTYKEHYIMWQCTEKFRVNGKKFDLNRLYINRYKYDTQQSKGRTKMTVSATAYSGDSLTSTLIKPYWGVIAVDPSVIPYGSVVYIKEFDKYFVAEDCGGGIQGKRIDIFMNSQRECRQWGVRKITIEIVR